MSADGWQAVAIAVAAFVTGFLCARDLYRAK